MNSNASYEAKKRGMQPLLSESRKRCVEEHGLDPGGVRPPNVLTAHEVNLHRSPVDDLLFEATVEMRNIYNRLKQYDYLISITDDKGATLHNLIPPSLEQDASMFLLHNGSIWSEDEQGTNGVGTGLASQRPVTVIKSEHFADKYSGLTCTTAPIFDAQRSLAAVLNVTTPRDTNKQEQAITRQLVTHAAKRIENMWFMNRYHDYNLLQVAQLNSFADIANGDLIALDNSGKLIASTLPLGSVLHPSSHKAAAKRDFVSNVLGVNIDQLNKSIRDREPICLNDSEQSKYYFHVRDPSSITFGGTSRKSFKKQAAKNFRKDEAPTLDELAGENKRLQRSVGIARKAFEAGLPILLTGATGSGKGAFAKALHMESSRAKKPFVPVNCAAIPETLFESVLFGYRPGAFTGADEKGSQGSILDANGGTLFLDEIGDMPINLQTRLLRVLSEKEVTPIGSSTPIAIDVNIISATLHDLNRRMSEGEFRDDLFFRIGSVTLTIPALQEREDRDEVIEQTLKRICREAKVSLGMSAAVRKILNEYHWKGNVRELLNVLKYAVVLDIDGEIGVDDLPDYLTEKTG